MVSPLLAVVATKPDTVPGTEQTVSIYLLENLRMVFKKDRIGECTAGHTGIRYIKMGCLYSPSKPSVSAPIIE